MKRLLLLVALLALPISAFADGYRMTTHKFPDGFTALSAGSIASGDYIPVYDASATDVKKLDATSLPLGAYDSSLITTSSALTGNPLTQTRLVGLTVAEVNAGTTFLASATGKTIYPSAGFSVMASGTAGGGTSISIKCSGGNIIATFPVANSYLTTGVPRGPFASTGSAGGGPTLASALTQGCPSGESIMASATGTITTMTHFYINFPYTVQ